jgi:hypothetical protein
MLPTSDPITVSPAESKIRIVLKKAERDYEKAMVGNSDGASVLTLGTDDVQFVYHRLRKRGVRFLGEPYHYPGRRCAAFRSGWQPHLAAAGVERRVATSPHAILSGAAVA